MVEEACQRECAVDAEQLPQSPEHRYKPHAGNRLQMSAGSDTVHVFSLGHQPFIGTSIESVILKMFRIV